MKKIILLLFVLILSACNSNNEKNAKKEVFDYSKGMEEIYTATFPETSLPDSLKICEKYGTDAVLKANCFLVIAFKTQDENYCDKIPAYDEIKNDTVEGKEVDEEITRENCHRLFNYENGNTRWRYISYLPPKYAESGYKYVGEAEVSGWIVYNEIYNEVEPQFHITPESVKNLPYKFNVTDFSFESSKKAFPEGKPLYDQADMIEKLEKNYSQEKPAKILIKEIRVPSEGPSVIKIVKVLN